MARTKTRPAPAPTAVHAAPDPAPAPDAAAAPGSPAAAVCAALAANPGSTVAVIAAAAGTGKPATRDALLAMEADGTATRVKGGLPGVPDTWTLTGPAPDDASPADPQDGQPGGDPGGSPHADGESDTAKADDAAPEEGEAASGISAAPGPEPALEDPAPADAGHDDAVPSDRDDDEPGSSAPEEPDDHDGPQEDEVPADPGGEDGDGPDPALVAEISERIEQIRAASDRAALALDAGGELPSALAGLDEIYEQAGQARRDLKAAIGGRKAPAVRPGGLREKVLAHLAANPGKDFTPHEIHKVNGHSSGAIANALETLVKLGQAEVASEKPRRFRLAESAEAAPGAGDAGRPAQTEDGAELAGAA